MRHAFLALILALVLGGCASLANDQTVCAEYRNLRCPAGTTCSMDQTRGCRVCQCNPIDKLQTTQPPDTNYLPPQPR
jgi:hypothetical protein